ncbi:MAG: hypothetical protein IPM51_01025 [Sphingobacteriaceae bacterium]|nr:hypothetical protein [Sphingobacteriaceae bacterium]
MNVKYKFFLSAVLLVFSSISFAQDDLLSLVDDGKSDPPQKVFATFKTYKLGNAQTTETVKKNHLDFRISHRFGNLYDRNLNNPINETFQNGIGFDAASDIRTSLDYGITENITVGIGRSKMRKMADASVKWRVLQQTSNFKIPVSIAIFADMGYTHARTDEPSMYGGIILDPGFTTNELHRFNYFSQVIIASKLSDWISVELLPSYVHRNFIKESRNPDNNAMDVNSFFTVGIGGRVKVTKRMCIIADYYYNTSAYYQNNPTVINPLAFGFELETGGHVFSLFFTNAAGLIENNFVPYTSDSWKDGQVKFGFSISRVFSL